MASAIQNWGEILRTQNLSSERVMDSVSRWLLITRASVFPLTLTSGAIGGLLAAGQPSANWGYFTLVLAGLLLAHAANNMINDYFDLESGVDEGEYVRAEYAPHPILSGLISKQGLIMAIAIVSMLDVGMLFYLTEAQGWPIAAFALAGMFVGAGYIARPIQLKHRGLGELGVALVWGPLMIGATFFATTGTIEPWVVVASLPYSLLVTAVLIGKHVDKIEADSEKGIHTLPVLLGTEKSLFLNQYLMVTFFVFVVSLVGVGTLSVWTLLVGGAVPHLVQVLKIYNQPPPAQAPPSYPIWPLWYAGWAFSLTRMAGGLFVLGLILEIFYPIPFG